MKRMMVTLLVLALALVLACGPACALPIELTNGPLTISAYDLHDNVTTDLPLDAFHLLSRDSAGNYLIYADQTLFGVEGGELSRTIPVPEEVPMLGELEAFAPGARSEAVIPMQRSLIALGYLASLADGDYGVGTETAVRAFQEAAGLEATGEADEITQLLIASMQEEPLQLEGIVPPEIMFAPLAGRTRLNLQPIMESGLFYDYDDITGEGFIAGRGAIEFDASGSTDLDRYELSLRFGLLTRENGASVEILPALEISCLCVRRPIMNALTLKAGDLRGSAPVESLTVALDGVYTVEKGIVLLTDEMVQALAGAKEAGELKLRIEGQYHSFNIAVDELEIPAQVGAIALEIKR